jgi:hypothetical protein
MLSSTTSFPQTRCPRHSKFRPAVGLGLPALVRLAHRQTSTAQGSPQSVTLAPEQHPAATDPSLAWDSVHLGRMPLMGFEPVVAVLPSSLVEPLLLHTFVALGSSQRPDEVRTPRQ